MSLSGLFSRGNKEKKEVGNIKGGNSISKEIASEKKVKSSARTNKNEPKVNAPVNNISNLKNKYVTGKIITVKFENFSEIPSQSIIVSDDKNHKLYIENEEIRKEAIILETTYSPNENVEGMSCYILILSSNVKSRMDLNDLKAVATENKKVLFANPRKNSKQFISELRKNIESNANNKEEVTSGNRKRVVELFEDVFSSGASDLHIEVRDKTRIRVRVNGEIRELTEYRDGYILNKETGFELARTIYNSFSQVANASFKERLTQDASGLIPNINGSDLKIRIANAPSDPNGFDMVIRLLVVKDTSKPITLEQLGYQQKQRNLIKEAVAQGVGVTIIAGTTGSGKSTTLQNVLIGEINNRNGSLKVITVEDPPEYFIAGATQIPVIRDKDGNAKTAFKNAIKAALRMDPDVIMIGEVRDEQSAELLMEAVQTGHKVLSTVHAGSALSILGRLENLGIDKETLADNEFISGLIYQKLFPVLCPHCSLSLKDGNIPVKHKLENILVDYNFVQPEVILKIKKKIGKKANIVRLLQDYREIDLPTAQNVFDIFHKINDEEENEKLLKRISSIAGNIKDHNIRFRGDGCEHCNNGIAGRTVVSEVVKPDMELRELISEGKNAAIYKYWRKNLGGKTAEEDAYDKMLEGIISPLDIEDTFGFIKPKTI